MPRLHAIAVVREADAAGAAGVLGAGLHARAGKLRGRAVAALAAALGGDRLAAEYVLLQLVSRCGAPSVLSGFGTRAASHSLRLPCKVVQAC